jgi:hypothetical protein
MVIKCLECNSYSSYTAWIGQMSRIGKGCSCPNQVWIDNNEKIRAEKLDKIEIWNDAEQKFVSYKRFLSLCSTTKACRLSSLGGTRA